MKKIKSNLTMLISDLHLGHENCLYNTYWYTIDKMVKEIKMLNNRYDWNEIYLVVNGDLVSGTMIYRNQYLQNSLNKNEDVILFGSHILHLTINKLEEALGKKMKIFIITGTHEGAMKTLPHNFSIAIARRLGSYGHIVRYASNYLILNIANGLSKEEYNILGFHGWGSADYSSVTPSLVRELTRVHSQLSTEKGIIIQRFVVSHTHWLTIGHNVLGIKIDVTGGFQKWDRKISWRESGMLYYTYDEKEDFDVKGLSGLKKQLIEADSQRLHTNNMRYISDKLEEAIDHEIKIGLLKKKDFMER